MAAPWHLLPSAVPHNAVLVRDLETRQLRVIKEIKAQNRQELEEALAEASLHATLTHENIIRYREVFKAGSRTIFIVMDYAPNGDLNGRIERQKRSHRPFPMEKVLVWLAQIIKALHYLHRQNKIHRDIKAANIFLNESDDVVLGDFGIARVLDANAARISARTCKTPVGTPMYMSPEQASAKEYGQAVDIWALGCVLYEMLMFKPAFIAQSMDGLMSRIRRGRFDRSFPPEVPVELQELVCAMLNVDPRARPTIRELIANPLIEPYVKEPAPASAKAAQPEAPAAPTSRTSTQGSVPSLHVHVADAKPRPAAQLAPLQQPRGRVLGALRVPSQVNVTEDPPGAAGAHPPAGTPGNDEHHRKSPTENRAKAVRDASRHRAINLEHQQIRRNSDFIDGRTPGSSPRNSPRIPRRRLSELPPSSLQHAPAPAPAQRRRSEGIVRRESSQWAVPNSGLIKPRRGSHARARQPMDMLSLAQLYK
ncbi:uncharacterized protein MONBRDRAFT_32577 [Monosiga brevicollis MX1]|uniref:non-specific serine/threonine protein kinase n=1 Tax=Monosiga brevicollis TaxID=81824 RepID=A9V0F4_MONBE|nr:uncharacterized protein MONBRDRAFT_32577 [Monosiga brevicollis MX1]EDQ89001.1 predicted protein [Monosiga brevicollis MX1]|eukprot:XP_001746106.1 hypothetical protein [Monosiga brevicollis MX1]